MVDGDAASDWADALGAMYDDPDTRAAMGRAAASRAENLGWNRTAAITLETYHAAVEQQLASGLIPAVPAP